MISDNSIARCINGIEQVTKCPVGTRAAYVDGIARCVPVDPSS